jgi:hypothetical protein
MAHQARRGATALRAGVAAAVLGGAMWTARAEEFFHLGEYVPQSEARRAALDKVATAVPAPIATTCRGETTAAPDATRPLCAVVVDATPQRTAAAVRERALGDLEGTTLRTEAELYTARRVAVRTGTRGTLKTLSDAGHPVAMALRAAGVPIETFSGTEPAIEEWQLQGDWGGEPRRMVVVSFGDADPRLLAAVQERQRQQEAAALRRKLEVEVAAAANYAKARGFREGWCEGAALTAAAAAVAFGVVTHLIWR